jgi:predicted transcriptional regulator
MEPSVSGRIDILLDKVKALREAMEARIEKAEDGPPAFWVEKEAGDQEASPSRLAKARNAFNDRLGTMKAAMVDLEDAGYAGAPRPAKVRYIYDRNSPHFRQCALDDGHEPGPAEMGLMYEAVVNSRAAPAGAVAMTVDVLCELEQALLRAWKWLKAKKRSKRKDAIFEDTAPLIHLAAEETTILEILHREYPMKVTQVDLAVETGLEIRTVRTHLGGLLKKKLVSKRPKGDKKGEAITAKGLSLISQRKK